MTSVTLPSLTRVLIQVQHSMSSFHTAPWVVPPHLPGSKTLLCHCSFDHHRFAAALLPRGKQVTVFDTSAKRAPRWYMLTGKPQTFAEMCFPCTPYLWLFLSLPTKGAIVGLLTGITLAFWAGIGSFIYPAPATKTLPLELSTLNCTLANTTSLLTTVAPTAAASRYFPITMGSAQHKHAPWQQPLQEASLSLSCLLRPLLADTWYSLSYLYFSAIGCLGCAIAGLLISFLTGWCFTKTKPYYKRTQLWGWRAAGEPCEQLAKPSLRGAWLLRAHLMLRHPELTPSFLQPYLQLPYLLLSGPTRGEDIPPVLIKPICNLFCFWSDRLKTLLWCGVRHDSQDVSTRAELWQPPATVTAGVTAWLEVRRAKPRLSSSQQ